jgi:hypothetical protein
MLEYIALALNEGKHEDDAGFKLLMTPVSAEISEYVQMITDATTSISKHLMTFQEKMIGQLTEAYNAYEQKWNEIFAKKRKLDEQINSMELPKINLPYNWKEYIELSEKLAAMTEDQRNALATFYKLLK